MKRVTRTKMVAALASAALVGSLGVAANGSASAATAVTFGSLASPCGKATGSNANPGHGVTSNSIQIAYGDDAGYNNTNAAMGIAVAAMIKWCNAQGGINGRQLIGDYNNAALTKAKQAVTPDCTRDFAIVGQGFAFDDAAEQVRMACDLISVPGFTATKQTENAWEMYQPNPNPLDYGSAALMAEGNKVLGNAGTSKVCAFRTDSITAAKYSVLRYEEIGPNFGVKFSPGCDKNVGYFDYASNPASIQAASTSFKSSGAKSIFWAATWNGDLTALLNDNATNKYNPNFLMEAANYTPDAAKWNAKNHNLGNGAYVRIAYAPLEAAKVVKAVGDFTKIAGPNGGTAIGEQAASAFLLFATAAKSCGSGLTKQCLVTKLAGIHSWNAGGLQGTSDPGNNMASTCGILMHLQGAKWVQAYPAKLGTFDCSSSYSVKTTALVNEVSQGGFSLVNRHDNEYVTGSTIKP